MSGSFSAFGLVVEADFPLPSVDATTPLEGRPVALRMAAPEEVDRAFSGSPSPRPWKGVLGDGEELAVELGRAGDVRFGYGKRASFRFDPATDLLECAPAEPGSMAWRRVLLTRVLPNAAIACGHEALHAAAVRGEAGTIAIVAPSGGGKSTLALELVRRGWGLVADDTVVLTREGETIVARSGGPFMNLAASLKAPAGARELGLFGDERWIAVGAAVAEPTPLAAIVFLARDEGQTLGALPMPGNPLELAPYMLGLPDDEGRDGARFDLYADLVERVPLLRLAAEPERRPAELARTVESALGEARRAFAGGVA